MIDDEGLSKELELRETTSLIRYAIRAELLVVRVVKPPSAGPPGRPRNGTARRRPAVARAAAARLLVGTGGGPLDPAGASDRHWADQGL